MHRRTFLKCTGALGAATAVSASLSACSSGPQSTNDTGGGGGKDRTLTAVIGYGNDRAGIRHRPRRPSAWRPTTTSTRACSTPTRSPASRTPALATALPHGPERHVLEVHAARRRQVARRQARHRRRRGVHLRPDPRPEGTDAAKGFFAGWLKEVRKIDDQNVELVLKFPFPDGRFTAHPREDHAEARLPEPGAWDACHRRQGVGSGPYKPDRAPPKSQHHLRGVRRLQRARAAPRSRR